MFVKLARASGHTYAQIVESYRDANGQPRQRNLLTLDQGELFTGGLSAGFA